MIRGGGGIGSHVYGTARSEQKPTRAKQRIRRDIIMKFTFLGTCSGTEPMPGRHHQSFTVQVGGLVYWFDAGENCAHRAYTSGIDVTRVRAVFISHMHIDHIGGLANLMMTIRKVTKRTGVPHVNDAYDIYVPDPEKLQAVKCIAEIPREATRGPVAMYEHPVCDGLLFEDEHLRVSALHNTHLRETGEHGWHSYSYLIEGKADGIRVVFSGDVQTPTELDPLVGEGCDALIMETGHHKVADVCDYVRARPIRQLLLTHHGREILGDPNAARRLLAERGVSGRVLEDGDVIEM